MSSSRGRIRVRVVDDDQDARDIYFEYLTFRGYDVILARDGVEAIDQARRHYPDVILMDIRMPLRSGTDAMRVLKADPRFAGIPIVALTAHALDIERQDALAAGFDAVISKPCFPDDVATAIEQLLAQRRDLI